MTAKSSWCGPAAGYEVASYGEVKSPPADFDSQTVEYHVFGGLSVSSAMALANVEYNDTHPVYTTSMWVTDVVAEVIDSNITRLLVDYKGCIGGEKRKRREATQQEIVVWTTTNQRETHDPEDDSVTGYQLLIPATVIVDTYVTKTQPAANAVGGNLTPPNAPTPASVPSFSSPNVITYVPNGWVLQSREKEIVGPSGGTCFVVTDTIAYYDPSGRPGGLNMITNSPVED